VAFGGIGTLVTGGIVKIAVFIVISPLLGMLLAIVFMNLALWAGQRATARERVTVARVNRWYRRGQLLSAAAYSLGHGANDAQKTMGVIAAVILIDRGLPIDEFKVTLPIVLAAHAAIALGTLSGGWRIVHTLGSKITRLQPVGGVSAESAAAVTLFGTAYLGIPVSTTHTITGAVVGVGSTNRLSAVRWGLTGRVIYAWVLTIPGSALIAGLSYEVLRVVPPAVAVAVGFIAAASWLVLFLLRRRREPEAVFAPP
jgi:inorganic phosphate transporter, PiT family